jgi:hypothetical protein
MSSFIVSDECINNFLVFITRNFSQNKLQTELGQELLKMIIEATNQRYPANHYLTPEEDKERIANFEFKARNVSKIQGLKSLQCFLYQCSEGTVPRMKLYKLMRDFEYNMAKEIISELPEYDKAEWG